MAVPAAAPAAPHRTLNVTQANTSASPVTWDGTVHDGANGQYNSNAAAPCGENTDTYCDDSLVNVDLPAGFRGGIQVDIDDYRPNPASDFDLYVYESDAAGHPLRLIPNDGSFGVVLVGAGLPNGLPESYSFAGKSGYYLVRVVYFDVPIASQYSGSIQLTNVIPIADTPPDVDSPAGLQEYLASDPGLGFKSHSEPHIAQSPTDPNILVAGSKQYYRDRDSLKEYEFKIGTYVSFDRGVTWTDLGQLDVCPLSQAPQSSYPASNTCYPDDDPDKGGTGAEDVKEDEEDMEFDDRGSGDLAEEYTTSDVWVQFDDEGSAYVMVLDHPPFPLQADPLGLGTEENGWGMTLHKWESVSSSDLRPGGRTWGPRVPINFYADEIRERVFLDDKNTMAVNNAGPDNDGKPGTILTCWGRSAIPAKQEIVCERSTDGGKSFPGEPIPVSEPQNLVIGVFVLADPKEENTFYLMWNYYVLTTSPANQMWFAKTTDGGQTWTPAAPVSAPFTPLPATYPGQQFRQLSIPMMAVAPNGELYATWSQYDAAPDAAADEDGLQADVVFVKSTNGGITWSTPAVVNQDKSNADQFQPQIAISPQGEVNIAYFDRRNDRRVVSGGQVTHAGNFFVDEYLSRSTDGGATWKDTRLSHEMSNPEHNDPISPSGLFFGDYQGMVADDCFAIPFFQDSHLSLDRARDSGFDAGYKRSDYQEVYAWRVPNEKQGPSCSAPVVGGPDPPVTPGGLPNVSVTAPRLASDTSTSSKFKVRVNASAANIDYYQLQYRRRGSSKWKFLSRKLLNAEFTFRGSYSQTYAFRARAIDLAGRAGPFSGEAVTVVPHDDRRSRGRPRYAGRWKRVKSGSAFKKSLAQSSRKGSSMRINFRGNRVYLVGRKGPSGGRALVILNGKRKRISFYSSKTRNRAVVYSSKLSAARGSTLTVISLGQKGSRKSKGRLVEIDGVGYRG
ncbi:MAG TPA: sialidase family protein [Thermoleophilaceae bacterium]